MKVQLFVKPIEAEVCDYIQRLHYDVSMRERIVANLLQNGDADVMESAAFKKYQDELQELNAEYMLVRGDLESKLLPYGFTGFSNAQWLIDFASRSFVVQLDSTNKDLSKSLEEKGFVKHD